MRYALKCARGLSMNTLGNNEENCEPTCLYCPLCQGILYKRTLNGKLLCYQCNVCSIHAWNDIEEVITESIKLRAYWQRYKK